MKALNFLKKLQESRDYDGNLEHSLNEAIAELEEAMKPKTCEECKGFVRYDYCSIIDDDCGVVMERCNGCKQFEQKDTK